MAIKRSVICFHKPNEENGYLSNWYKSNFVFSTVSLHIDLRGMKQIKYEHGRYFITFTSMEQYMMWQKAMLFGDITIARKILETNDVAVIKQLGREVHNFDEDMWEWQGYSIVVNGLLLKFMQNEELRKKLLSTGDAVLAECAVKDKKWGIGLSMTDEKRFNPAYWSGENLLGKALMEARAKISLCVMGG